MEPEKVKKLLICMQALYKVEKDAGEDCEQREKLRAEVSKGVVDAIFAYLHKTYAESNLPDRSPFIKAINYAREREAGLRVFLNDPAVPIDNNHTEREIRPVAIGRKNWVFHSTEYGARYSAILYSLISSCRLQGVDPTTYLVDVLQRAYSRPSGSRHRAPDSAAMERELRHRASELDRQTPLAQATRTSLDRSHLKGIFNDAPGASLSSR